MAYEKGYGATEEKKNTSWWDSWTDPQPQKPSGYYPQPSPELQEDWVAPQRGYDPRWDDPNYGKPKDTQQQQPLTVWGGQSPGTQQASPQGGQAQSTLDLLSPQPYQGREEQPIVSLGGFGPTQKWNAPDNPLVYNPEYQPNSPLVSAPSQQQGQTGTKYNNNISDLGTWASDTWSGFTNWYSNSAGGKAAQENSQNRWAAYEESTNTVGGREVEGYFKAPTIENNNTIDWGIAKPVVQGAANLGTGAANLGIDAWNWIQGTKPGDSVADAMTWAGNYGMDALEAADAVTAKSVATEEIGNTGLSLGALSESINSSAGPSFWDLKKNPELAKNLPNPLEAIKNLFTGTRDRITQHKESRALIETLGVDGVKDVDLALLRTYAGPDVVIKAANAIASQGDDVAALQAQAAELQTQAEQAGTEEEQQDLMLQSALLGAKAEELKDKSALEISDSYQNVWKELGFELVLDPTNLFGWVFDVAGLSVKAGRLKGASTFVEGAPDAPDATTAIQKAWDEAMSAMGDLGAAGTKGKYSQGWWTPTTGTANAQAETAVNEIWRNMSTLVGNSKDRGEALTILDKLTSDPASLVNGVNKYLSKELKQLGLGNLTDKGLLKNLDVLAEARDEILNLKSLKGDGLFNPAEFFAELDGVLQGAAKRVYSLAPAKLPGGATTVKKFTNADGTSTIKYVDANGEIVKETTYSAAKANEVYKEANLALKGKVDGDGLTKALKGVSAPSTFVRALMSEMWLNMRPSNWVKQGVGAFGHLTADGLNSFVRISEVDEWFTAKYGMNTPSRKMGTEALSLSDELGQGQESMFRNLTLGKQNPLSLWSETGAGIWNTNELNFRKRATYGGAKQAFGQEWKKAIETDFMPALLATGMDESQARVIADLAYDLGKNGSIQDVQKLVRGALDSPLETFSLRSLGIDDEVLSSEGIKEIYGLVAGRQKLSPEEFSAAFDDIIVKEQARYGSILNDAPVTPRQYAWNAVDGPEEGAAIIDDMIAAAKKSGVDPAQAKVEAEELVKRMIDSEAQAFQTMLDDLGSSGDTAQLWAAADMWMEVRDLKQVYRQRIGDWARSAMNPDEAYTWDQYWNNTKETWAKFSDELGQISDQYRGVLNGAPQRKKYSPLDILERHAKADLEDIVIAKNQAAGAAEVGNDGYKAVIDASRAYVDEFATELYSTFKRFTSSDALELVISAEMQSQKAGQQVAGYLAGLRQKMLDGTMMVSEYREIRDATWQQFSDTAAIIYSNATREIARRGFAQASPTGLKWADEFAGGEFELIHVGANKNGKQTAIARRLDDGTMHEFALPDKVYDAKAATSLNVDSGMPRPEQIKQEIASLQEARKMMSDVWYQIGTAAGGVNRIDQIIATYKRNGIVTVPENFGEQLIGKNIAGVEINTTDDLNRLLSSYSQLADDIKQLRIEAKQIKNESVLSPTVKGERLALPQVPADVYDDYMIVVAQSDEVLGASDEVIQSLDEIPDVAPTVANPTGTPTAKGAKKKMTAEELKAWRKRNRSVIKAENELKIFGMEDGANFTEELGKINKGYQQTGGMYQLNPGDLASYYFDKLEDSRSSFLNKLEQIQTAGEEIFTQEQKLRAIDALSSLTGKWGDVTQAALKAGEKAADFAMLDYSNATRLDKWIGLFVPYHYYYTRSMMNWGRRTATRPDLLMNYMKVDEAVEDANESSATRTTGQIKVGNDGTNSYYMSNPLDLLLPYGSFGVNDYANPDEAQTNVGRITENLKMAGFGLMPYMDAAAKWADGRGGEVDFGDYVWMWRSLGYLKQAATGRNLPGAGDQFDPYRTGTKLAVQGQQGDLSPTDVAFGQDVVYQNQSGEGPLPEQSFMSPNAPKNELEASKLAGQDRALTLVLRDLFGVTINPYPDAEEELRQTSGQYRTLGYGEFGPFGPVDNLYGSKAATKGFFEAEPNVGNWWNRTSLVPGADEEEGFNRPSLRTINDERNDLSKATSGELYAIQDAAVDDAIAANPDITKKEMNAAKETAVIAEAKRRLGADVVEKFLQDNPEAWIPDIIKFVSSTIADTKYPSAELYQYPESDAHDYAKMNPDEATDKATKDATDAAKKLPGAPVYPGAGATKAEINAYYDAKEIYDAKKEEFLTQALSLIEAGNWAELGPMIYPNSPNMFSPTTDPMAPMSRPQATGLGADGQWSGFGSPDPNAPLSRPGQPPTGELFGPPTQPEAKPTAADLLKNPFVTEAEQQRLDELAAENAATAAEIEASITNIEAEFGPEAAQKYRDYLDADDETRLQIKANDPQFKLFTILSFNPTEYAEVKSTFGDDAWQLWSNIPTYDGSPEQNDARREYFAANPKAKAINAWVSGRPKPFVEGEKTEGDFRNWGTDYKEAQKMFGDDIFIIWSNYNSGWDRGTKRAYFDANPQLKEFNNWWYALVNTGEESVNGAGAGAGAGASAGAGNGRQRAAFVSEDGKVHYDQYGRRLDSNGNVARWGRGGGGGGGGGGGFGGISNATVREARLNPREMRNYGPTRKWEAPYAPNLSAVNNARALGPSDLEVWRLPQKVPTLG